jgi:Neutral/alkaline non-lysosomal ceramidase, N-terminal
MKSSLLAILICFGVLAFAASGQPVQAAEWQAGFARQVITPPKFIWMSGYGARTAPADGKIQDLYVRVAAIQASDESKPALFISLDLVGVPIRMVKTLTAEFDKKFGIPRSNIIVACSHTHSGPALDDDLSWMLAMTEQDWSDVRENQLWLNDQIRLAVDTAIKDKSPALISFGNGTCGFASNRRPPLGKGPVDHMVPVLKVTDPANKIRGIIFGYACHNTTLGLQQWCGDYAGFAQLHLEDTYPDSVAMFFSGCGADQNPLPRHTIELCEMYGRLLSISVQEVLDGKTQPLDTALKTGFTEIPLKFAKAPSRQELEQKLEAGSRYEKNWAKNQLEDLADGELEMSYPYPVQVWTLGNKLKWVALGGEVVVDYSLRLKNELGADTTWVTGYANDVMAYIPSERVLTEGGYEGGGAMLYYQKPSPWKAGLEDQIIKAVHKLVNDQALP